MTHPALSFGPLETTGELARTAETFDELAVEMALALGDPPLGPLPPFAIVPVLLNGQPIGRLEKIVLPWDEAPIYQFRSLSGNTHFCSTSRDAVLQRLDEVLGFTQVHQG